MAKVWAPRRFSKLSWFSCLSSLTEGHCPAEPVPPALGLDAARAPRPLLDGDDLNAVKEGDDNLDCHSKKKDVTILLKKTIKYYLGMENKKQEKQ